MMRSSTSGGAQRLISGPRWIVRGELLAVKLHRKWRVRVPELGRLLVGDSDAA